MPLQAGTLQGWPYRAADQVVEVERSAGFQRREDPIGFWIAQTQTVGVQLLREKANHGHGGFALARLWFGAVKPGAGPDISFPH